MKTIAALLIGSALAGAGLAQEATFIDLTGVQIKNATNQSRTSAGTINPSCYYDYSIDGMVRGSGLVLGALFPNPTPLAQALETLSPGSSAFLTGRALNPGGAHPAVLLSAPFSGSQVILGVTVTFSANIEVGIRADNIAYFNLTNVVLSPASLVGSMTFTTGRADIVRFVCPADINCDGFIDFADYLEFLNRYDAQDPSADLNGDGFVDFIDYLEFLNIYEAGC
ncbi:MAG: hypothetical protein IT436_05835 [Phycisphaerales bacterium]|nr:hypothetical protein [Phycisphaerales bacterium]